MITAVNVPDATSLSTMRMEQAGKFAACFLVNSRIPQNRQGETPSSRDFFPTNRVNGLFMRLFCHAGPWVFRLSTEEPIVV
jgi:hypothetical protein